jgi:hypothetical protein
MDKTEINHSESIQLILYSKRPTNESVVNPNADVLTRFHWNCAKIPFSNGRTGEPWEVEKFRTALPPTRKLKANKAVDVVGN